jgi:hypothetical protein
MEQRIDVNTRQENARGEDQDAKSVRAKYKHEDETIATRKQEHGKSTMQFVIADLAQTASPLKCALKESLNFWWLLWWGKLAQETRKLCDVVCVVAALNPRSSWITKPLEHPTLNHPAKPTFRSKEEQVKLCNRKPWKYKQAWSIENAKGNAAHMISIRGRVKREEHL